MSLHFGKQGRLQKGGFVRRRNGQGIKVGATGDRKTKVILQHEWFCSSKCCYKKHIVQQQTKFSEK